MAMCGKTRYNCPLQEHKLLIDSIAQRGGSDLVHTCGINSVVECHLAKVKVASRISYPAPDI